VLCNFPHSPVTSFLLYPIFFCITVLKHTRTHNIRVIKSRRIMCGTNSMHGRDARYEFEIFVEKPWWKDFLMHTWEDNIKIYLREREREREGMEIWTMKVAKKRIKLRTSVNVVIKPCPVALPNNNWTKSLHRVCVCVKAILFPEGNWQLKNCGYERRRKPEIL
jgi:hypothetical protein